MADTLVDEIKSNYVKNFRPEDYHKEMVDDLLYESSEDYTESFAALYKVVKSGRFKGNKLLEIGSGPTVHHVASASAYYSEIIQSEFVESCCEELRKWLRGESKLDWSPFLNIIAQVEGHKDIESGRRKIEARIRKNVKAVVHCDVLSEEIVPPEVTTEYDLIITAGALCAAAPDYETYKIILKRINRLLRPGGGLIITGLFNDEEWGINGNRFHTLRLNQEQIDQALEFAGFIDRDWAVFPKPATCTCIYDNMFNVAATKM